MPSYRVKLDTIRCLKQRCEGRHNDTLEILFYIVHAGMPHQSGVFLESHLGIPGPHMDIHFGPGYEFKLVRDDTAFGYGRDFDWELTVELPDDSEENYEVGIILINDRGIDDPYAVTKVLATLGVAVGAGVAGSLIAEQAEKTFAAFVTHALQEVGKEVGVEIFKELIGHLLGDWPKCTGIAFQKALIWNRHNFQQNVGSFTVESGVIDEVPEGCNQPHYQVDISVEALWQPQFGTSEKVRTRRYHAVKAPARTLWLGSWYESASNPNISMKIAQAPGGDPDNYQLTFSERAAYQNSHRTIIELTTEMVTESSTFDLFYSGEILNATATGIEVADTLGNSPLSPRVQELQQEIDEAAVWPGAGSVAMRNRTLSRTLGGIRSPSVLSAVREGRAARTLDQPGVLTRDRIDEVIGASATEEGATLYLPAHGITLRLYDVEDVLETGEVRRWGPVLRYYRKPRLTTTVADVQLGKYRLIR